MNKVEKEYTDWTKYYEAPKSKFSAITQRVTLKRIVWLIEKYLLEEGRLDIIELGGGNSCFAEGIVGKINVSTYSIVDNNELSIEKAKKKGIPIKCYCCDVLSDMEMRKIPNNYHVSYSVGLIEHFRGEDIDKIIDAHFKLISDDGLVIITFPTPTIQYRIIRKTMEKLGVWQFWDEKPLRWEDVRAVFERNGTVLYHKINYQLPLTQMIVVAKKNI